MGALAPIASLASRFAREIAIYGATKRGALVLCIASVMLSAYGATVSSHPIASVVQAGLWTVAAVFAWRAPGATLVESRSRFASMTPGERLQRSVLAAVFAASLALVGGVGLWEALLRR